MQGTGQPGQRALPTLTTPPQSSIRRVCPGALPRGSICQALPCAVVLQRATPQAASIGVRSAWLQGGSRGKLGRQQAGSPGKGTHKSSQSQVGPKGPSHSHKSARQCGNFGPPLPPQSAPSHGASCGGWISPPGKGSDVKRQEGRMSCKERGGSRQVESQSRSEGTGTFSLCLWLKNSWAHRCARLRSY